MFPIVNFSNCDQETSALALQKYTEFIWRLGVLFQTRNGEKLIVCCKIFIFSLLDRLSGGCGLNFWRVGSLENCQIMSKLQHYCSAGHTLDVSAFTHSKKNNPSFVNIIWSVKIEIIQLLYRHQAQWDLFNLYPLHLPSKFQIYFIFFF